MPWQQDVADVLMEIDPDTGRLVYDEWILTVPRQSGKSTFVEAKFTHRCTATKFFGPRQHLVYAAQTRKKALEKWEEEFIPDLQASSYFANRFEPKKPPGNEHFRFSNGSRLGMDAPTDTAGHGSTLDEAFLDEAFAHQDWRLEQALGPAMITRPNKQLGIISTAGWLNGSPYLEAKIAVGRAAVRDGVQTGTAHFEWAAAPGADPGDERTWWSCMPALGRTITVAAIRAEYRKAAAAGKLNEFRRAYLNQWVPKDVTDDWSVIGADAWGACAARSPVAL
jgi:phage terminase large subunit-like protein